MIRVFLCRVLRTMFVSLSLRSVTMLEEILRPGWLARLWRHQPLLGRSRKRNTKIKPEKKTPPKKYQQRQRKWMEKKRREYHKGKGRKEKESRRKNVHLGPQMRQCHGQGRSLSPFDHRFSLSSRIVYFFFLPFFPSHSYFLEKSSRPKYPSLFFFWSAPLCGQQ